MVATFQKKNLLFQEELLRLRSSTKFKQKSNVFLNKTMDILHYVKLLTVKYQYIKYHIKYDTVLKGIKFKDHSNNEQNIEKEQAN